MCQQFSNMRTMREFGEEILTPLILKEYFYDEFQRNRGVGKTMPNIGDKVAVLCFFILLHRMDVRDFPPMVRKRGIGGYVLPWSTK